MTIRVHYLHDFKACDAYRHALDAAADSPFARIAWFERLWQHVPPGQRLLIVRAVHAAGEAWLFLAESEGGSVVALSHMFTFAFMPIFTGTQSAALHLQLLGAMARSLRQRRVSRLILGPLPPSSEQALTIAFAAHDWHVRPKQTSTRWWCPVPEGGFEAYWAERPGALRSTVKRKRAAAKPEIRIETRFDPASWAEYERVYGSSWKPEERDIQFLRAFAEMEGAAGRLRLGCLGIGGETVAAQFWTVDGGCAYIHKLAHRENARAHSPGSLLSAAMFAHVIDTDHVKMIDFGTGDDPYKRDWMTVRDPLITLDLAHARGLAGAGALGRGLAGDLVRTLRRR